MSELLRPRKGFDSCATGISRRCANNRKAGATVCQDMIHQTGQQLHGNILERHGGAMEQFQNELIGSGLDERGNGGMLKNLHRAASTNF